MTTIHKPRAPKKAPPLSTVAPSLPPADHAPQTHAFAFSIGCSFAVCPCGAERDLQVRGGSAVRFYRLTANEPWGEFIGACAKSAGVPPPPLPPPAAPPEPTGERVVSGLERVLRAHYPDAFAPELIDGCDVEKAAADVDLSIAFSPVLDQRDSLIPVDAVPLGGDRYRIFGEPAPRDVSAADIRVMRARFLLMRGAVMRRLPTMEPRQRERIERSFFPRGDVPWVPPAGSPLHRQMLTGGVISIPREGDGPVDFLALMRALSTPGGEMPAVCPVLPSAPAQDPQ